MKIKIRNLKLKISRRLIVILTGLIVAGLLITSTILILLEDKNELMEKDAVTELTEAQFQEASRFNRAFIGQYNTADNCWIIHKNSVYDVTSILGDLADVSEDSCGTELEGLSADSTSQIAPYIVSSLVK